MLEESTCARRPFRTAQIETHSPTFSLDKGLAAIFRALSQNRTLTPLKFFPVVLLVSFSPNPIPLLALTAPPLSPPLLRAHTRRNLSRVTCFFVPQSPRWHFVVSPLPAFRHVGSPSWWYQRGRCTFLSQQEAVHALLAIAVVMRHASQ